MAKEKFHIEYVLNNCSAAVLWDAISSAEGLAKWFADEVSVSGKTYSFSWNKTSADAELVLYRNGQYVRFHWEDDDFEKSYFEFRISIDILTNDVTLTITDFCEPDEKTDAISLWQKQIEDLKRCIGV